MYIQNTTRGFPTGNKIAFPHKRFVGLYYYDYYFRTWDEIIGIDGNWWIVKEVGTDYIRKHITTLWADAFADKPFDLKTGKEITHV